MVLAGQKSVRGPVSRASDLLTPQSLAADVLEESLEQSCRHRIREDLGLRKDPGKKTIFEAGNDHAVFGGMREIHRSKGGM